MLYSIFYHFPMGNLKLSKKVAIVFLTVSFIYVFVHSFLFSKEHSIFFLKTLSQYFYIILCIDIIGVIAIHKLTHKDEENENTNVKSNLLKKNSMNDMNIYKNVFDNTNINTSVNDNDSLHEFPTEKNTKNDPMKYVKMNGTDLIEG